VNYLETKKLMMKAYPTLFLDEADVLHHLFAVGGNGYDWIDGELSSGRTPEEVLEEARQCEEDSRRHREEIIQSWKKLDAELHEVLKGSGVKPPKTLRVFNRPEKVPTTPAEIRKAEQARRLWYAKEMPGDCYFLRKDGSVGRRLHPMCQYADILHVPEDVKPDWLAAACKAVMVLRTEFKCTKEDLKWLKKAEALLSTRSRNLKKKATLGRRRSSTKTSTKSA
jgi:hypothetical protein